MTLKETFRKLNLSTWINFDDAIKCEELADEYAIEFADWIRVCKLKGRGYDFDNIEELLTIYKEEKGL